MKTIGSLCTGIGGMELGLGEAYKTIWQAEVDKHASTVLEERFPGSPNLGDITEINWSEVETPDLLVAGFPCQDISMAGKGEGIVEGNRSGLWFEVARAIRVLRPREVFLENVSAILIRGFEIVIGDLAQMGYVGSWGCIRASETGAPHKRERWFLLAAHSNSQLGR